MRIIGGTYRGRTLAGPKWAGLRPTSDKLRETLFNILGSSVAGARVLDAFAGTDDLLRLPGFTGAAPQMFG